MDWFLILIFAGATLFSLFATFVVRYFALRLGVTDKPDGSRKLHKKPIPLLGGTAIFAVVAVFVIASLIFGSTLTGGLVQSRAYMGFLLGGLILIIGGALDDRFELPPHLSMIAPVLAALCAVMGGIAINKLSHPLGGFIDISGWISSVLVFGWLIVMMYTSKLLDGLDGLSGGVSVIGMFVIIALSLTAKYFQPDVSLFAVICAGAVMGFLFWNMPPAKIFLGEGGSTLVGYMLAILAVISGGKLAIALLVMGIPLLDVAWVMIKRWKAQGIKAIVKGDRRHLHHRLIEHGFSSKKVLLLYFGVSIVFGGSALFLQTGQKMIAFFLLILLLAGISSLLWISERKNSI